MRGIWSTCGDRWPYNEEESFEVVRETVEKWAADEDKRPSSAVWVKRGGRERRQEVHNLINFNFNQFNDHDEYFEGRDAGILQDPAVLNL